MTPRVLNIGIISTRLTGTDGVSLEVTKWVKVLKDLGHHCFFFGGELSWPAEVSYQVPEAHFQHPEIRKLNVDLFDDYCRSPQTSLMIDKLRLHLKGHLHKFVNEFQLQLLIIENALSLPMNVPLGLAITELIAEHALPTLAHHHDFSWERKRYSLSAADDYIRAAFPPTLNSIRHVVINSYAQRQLALRTGVSATLIPNVMDFDSAVPNPGDYVQDLRARLHIPAAKFLLLQPTRIVPRKRIEQAIELTRRLGDDCVLVITHHAGDEGAAYEDYLREYARLMGIQVCFAAQYFAPARGRTTEGEKIYSLADAYSEASLVTYPSLVEGFGNALLESIYFKRPIFISNYEILKTDVQPKGFRMITFDDFISDACVYEARRILDNPELAQEMVEHNYELGRRHYSYRMLHHRLEILLNEMLGLD